MRILKVENGVQQDASVQYTRMSLFFSGELENDHFGILLSVKKKKNAEIR